MYICSNSRGSDHRSFKRSGRSTPSGKRSLPQTPTNYMSDGEMSDGGSSATGSYINRLQCNNDLKGLIGFSNIVIAILDLFSIAPHLVIALPTLR